MVSLHRLAWALCTLFFLGCQERPLGPIPDTANDPGAKLFGTHCVSCHPNDNSVAGTGPKLRALYNSFVRLDDGSDVKADEAYLKQSILSPDAKVVAGYKKGDMTDFGKTLSEDDVNALVAFLKKY
jgi:mono/diheme cytochrome c family protein